MRILLLAAAATGSLSLGAAASLQAVRTPAASPVGAPEGVALAAAPEPEQRADAQTPVVAEPQAEPAKVVLVKTVRIGPMPAPAAADEARAPVPEPARAEAPNAVPERAPPVQQAAVTVPAKDEQIDRAPAREGRPTVVVTRKPSHHKRRVRVASRQVQEEEPAAPKQPGPESLNPLGKLLSR